MEFENGFEVAAPIEQVWQTMLDLERVAPCMPGAEVLEQPAHDVYKVGIRVKVGPVSMQYRGNIEIVARDDAAHRATMRATAKETRGQGTANADVEMRLSGDGATTSATIVTQLQIRGKAAAMGQGVMQDVAAKLVADFAGNLSAMLAGAPAVSEPEPAGFPQPALPQPVAAPPPPALPQAPGPRDLSALELAGAVAAGRLRNPRNLVLALAAVFLLGYLLGRRG